MANLELPIKIRTRDCVVNGRPGYFHTWEQYSEVNPNKECFLEDLSEVIDEPAKEGATYFDMTFETDAKIPVVKEIDIL